MSQPIVAVVRGIPHPPYKHRWCGSEYWKPDPKKRPQQEMEELPSGGFKPKFNPDGTPKYARHALPWPDDETKVFVVDDPPPYDPDANGGRPTHISPRTLDMLKKDRRCSVQILNGEGGDPADAVQAKAHAAKLEEKLEAAERHIASLQEQIGAARESEAAKAAGEIAKLRQELAEMKSKIAERKK